MRALTVVAEPGDRVLDQGRRGLSWSRESFELLFTAILPPMDLLAAATAVSVASALGAGLEPGATSGTTTGVAGWLMALCGFTAVWLASFALAGLYDESKLGSRWDETVRVFLAVSTAMSLMALTRSAGVPALPWMDVSVPGGLLGFVLVAGSRQLVRFTHRQLFARDVGVRYAVLVGSGPVAQRLVSVLNHDGRSGHRVIGLIDRAEPEAAPSSGLPVFANAEEMLWALGERVDELIQADSSLSSDETGRIVRFATEHQLAYRIVPPQVGGDAGHGVLDVLAGLPVVRLRHTPLEGWGRIIKRGLDIVLALAGVVALLPVLAVVALLIKVCDPGPVIFMHERLARGGRPFHIYKFRTMRTKYSGQPPLEVFRSLGRLDLVEEFQVDQKVKDDPRVSRLGAFLRKYSIDELPQLWNVVLGHLSLVGPRPIVVEELPKFGDAAPLILALRPGITGAWQISGRNDLSYEDRVRLNLEYVRHWSLLLDIRILLRTLVVLARGSGAY